MVTYTFNSLFEMRRGAEGADGVLLYVLSILYLRCPRVCDMNIQYGYVVSFNSLFEMHVDYEILKSAPTGIFQFSI